MKWHHNCLEHLCTILFEKKNNKRRTSDKVPNIWQFDLNCHSQKVKKKKSHNIIIGKTTKEPNRYIFSRKAANRMKRKIKTIALRDWHFSNLFSAGTTKKTRRNNNGTSIPFCSLVYFLSWKTASFDVRTYQCAHEAAFVTQNKSIILKELHCAQTRKKNCIVCARKTERETYSQEKG